SEPGWGELDHPLPPTFASLRLATSPLQGEVKKASGGYATFSTYTLMVPPQDSPTFHAVSSATPNSSVFGLPLSITSMASVTTAPSTQPPDTLPRKLPSLSITRLEPTGRGAEPQVSTTVASATPRPSFVQSSAALR